MNCQSLKVQLRCFGDNVRLLLEPQSAPSLAFINAVQRKCNEYGNVYEPFEVISIAYEKGQRELLVKGNKNPVLYTRAWMLKTIKYILITEKRKNQRRQEKSVSIHSEISSSGSSRTLLLEEVISSEVDPENLYALVETEEKIQKCHLARKALQTLSEHEQKLLKLRLIEEYSWEEVARHLGSDKRLDTLRQQGSRALKKLKNEFERLVAQNK